MEHERNIKASFFTGSLERDQFLSVKANVIWTIFRANKVET
jgi:hypothetical protein